MRRSFLSPRLMKFWCSAVVVATLAVLGASTGFTACNQACKVACKEDNNWCYDYGVMGGQYGRKYYTDAGLMTAQVVAFDDQCVEKGTEDGGVTEDVDTVWFKQTTACTPDCSTFGEVTTGAPDLSTVVTGGPTFEDLARKCSDP